MADVTTEVKENIVKFLDELEIVCAGCGRDAKNITVLGAGKYATPDDLNEARLAGIKVFGFNKVQNAEESLGCFKESLDCFKEGAEFFKEGADFSLRFIGHLQTNKVKKAVKLFDMIESVDSSRLAKKISEECVKAGASMDVLIEVNISRDSGKFGVAPDLVEIEGLANVIEALPGLKLRGLMCILPQGADERIRKCCHDMKRLFDGVKVGRGAVDTLSMGMSGDWKIAVEEGSTEVRIGSLFFK